MQYTKTITLKQDEVIYDIVRAKTDNERGVFVPITIKARIKEFPNTRQMEFTLSLDKPLDKQIEDMKNVAFDGLKNELSEW